ncbi:MAG: hypothetical protein JO006_08805 [Paucibacter sp.]|nr:hypothetical protein [Roseateles sp.]
MNSLSDAGPAARALSRRAQVIALTLSLAVMALAVLLLHDDAASAPLLVALLLTVLLLPVVAGLAWHFGGVLMRRQYEILLREARSQLQVAARLQRDWQWATDADHHLVRWQAPQRVPASSWVGHAVTQTLLERFDSPGDCELRSALAAHRDFDGIPAREASGAQWMLRGVACTDGQGRFAGYVGTAERICDDRAQADQAAFGYTISHDLRAPLRVVEGFARILKEDYGAQLDPRGLDHVERVLGAAGRMQGMIDALLSLTQLSVRPLVRERVELSALAQAILEELREGAPPRATELLVEPGLVAEGDPVLLRIALENLLGNAWKYSAGCECTRIRFEQRQQGGRRVFVIVDQGAGFDMASADRLFNAFQRLHSNSDFPGAGIGLASVRRIVRRHGGDVWAESEPGQGARFYFTLA